MFKLFSQLTGQITMLAHNVFIVKGHSTEFTPEVQ